MNFASCVLKIGVLGLNHKTADLSCREAMAKGADALAGERALFFDHPTVLLSTCNRTEIYFSGDNLAEAHSDLLAFLRRHIEPPFEHRLYSYFGIDCFTHLCRVASGLDSAILAETEIQRQVKVAYQRATLVSPLPSCLHFAFQKALKVGKLVRTQEELQRGLPTLSSIIWRLSKEMFPDLERRSILFVGNSEINRTLISYFSRKNAIFMTLCTRDPLQAHVGYCRSVDRSLLVNWSRFDLIICGSKSPEYLIRGSSDQMHLLFDLSVPRNIDPELAKNHRLYNIEQLCQKIAEQRSSQSSEFERCEEVIGNEARKLASIYREKRACVRTHSAQLSSF